MSYSFTVTADTKAEAKAAIEAEFDKVLTQQPVHAADLPAARVAAAAFVDVLNEPTEAEQVKVNVGGYVSWRTAGEFIGAKLDVNASTVLKD